jgi:hypothetical protein
MVCECLMMDWKFILVVAFNYTEFLVIIPSTAITLDKLW